MGHHIEAIVTAQRPNFEKLKALELPHFIENEFYIIPLDSCHAHYWGKLWNVYDEYGEHFGGVNLICMKSILKMMQEIEVVDFVLLGTDYHGGIGDQAANVFKQGVQIDVPSSHLGNKFGLHGIDINTALKKIGVVRTPWKDEFDTINLGNYRCFERYFEAYEHYCDED